MPGLTLYYLSNVCVYIFLIAFLFSYYYIIFSYGIHGRSDMLYCLNVIPNKNCLVNRLVVFEIFAKIAIWPLDLGPRLAVMAPNESSYMVSYMSLIEMKSLSLAVFKIFAKITFWPLYLGPRSKVMAPNESPYVVSNMSLIEMKFLSLAVF